MISDDTYDHLIYNLGRGVEAQADELKALARRAGDTDTADTLDQAADMLLKAAQLIGDAADTARYA